MCAKFPTPNIDQPYKHTEQAGKIVGISPKACDYKFNKNGTHKFWNLFKLTQSYGRTLLL